MTLISRGSPCLRHSPGGLFGFWKIPGARPEQAGICVIRRAFLPQRAWAERTYRTSPGAECKSPDHI
jgi:hypothetical protein